MANKKCVALTREQLEEIITTMRSGGAGFRPNEQIATGHLMRCIAIAEAIRMQGENVIFIIADNHAIDILNIEKPEGASEKNYNFNEKKYLAVPDVVGLSLKDAMKLIVRARFNKIIEEIKNEEIKNEILEEIDKRLD